MNKGISADGSGHPSESNGFHGFYLNSGSFPLKLNLSLQRFLPPGRIFQVPALVCDT